nr:unnamed protein product [Digitaria exilis]
MPPPPPRQKLFEVFWKEVLVRFPPDESASLLHAAVACKRRARVVADPGFRARFRGFHGGDSVPRFLSDLRGDAEGSISRVVRTSTFRPRRSERLCWRAADARHGRVHLYTVRDGIPFSWSDLIDTGDLRRLFTPPRPRPRSWNAALLCGGPFRVVVVGTDEGGFFCFLYSSEDGARSVEASTEQEIGVDPAPPAQSPESPAPPLDRFSMDSVIDDALEEILLRLPRDDPATLIRAGAVCKRWSGIISSPGFRRSFAQPALAGFVANLRDGDSGGDTDFVARFVPTSDDPSFPPGTDHRARRALDARHGRVLLATTASGGLRLEVWEPTTGVLRELPPPPRTLHDSVLDDPFGWNAAVLGGTHGTPDNLHCQPPAPFRVVLLDDDGSKCKLRLHIYSSEGDAWSQAKYGPLSPLLGVDTAPPALVKSKLFFLIDANSKILQYDLSSERMDVILLPRDHYKQQFNVLTTTEQGGLGLARICSKEIVLWSMNMDSEGVVSWEETDTLDLTKLLPPDAFPISEVYLGFAHGLQHSELTLHEELKFLLQGLLREEGNGKCVLPLLGLDSRSASESATEIDNGAGAKKKTTRTTLPCDANNFD